MSCPGCDVLFCYICGIARDDGNEAGCCVNGCVSYCDEYCDCMPEPGEEE